MFRAAAAAAAAGTGVAAARVSWWLVDVLLTAVAVFGFVLAGGAMLGLHHFGLIEALLFNNEAGENLLPKVPSCCCCCCLVWDWASERA